MIRKKIYREHFLSEICPKIEKTTDYQWFLSGWQDSNLRPPHPKCGAIPGYATPRLVSFRYRAQIYIEIRICQDILEKKIKSPYKHIQLHSFRSFYKT